MLAQTVCENLCQIAREFSRATGQPLSVVSKRAYGRSSFFAEYRKGKQTITTDKVEEILRYFRREWPENADWPFTRAVFMDRRNGK